MSKFSKILFALGLSIVFVNPVFAIDELFDPLADLYSELEKKAEIETTSPEPEENTTENYLSELQKMAERMEETMANNAKKTIPTAQPTSDNPISSPAKIQVSQAGGAIENIQITKPKTTPIIANQSNDSEIFVFAYDGSSQSHFSANELSAAGPAALAIFSLVGGLAGTYFFRRKILNV